jgi:glycyl-tRNA synthetase beta subunit
VRAEQGYNPAKAAKVIRQLTTWVERPDWAPILDAFARCVRIIRSIPETYTLHGERFKIPAEQELYTAYQVLKQGLPADYNIGEFLGRFEMVVPSVTAFFEGVMVMDENLELRENRLALLQALTGLARDRADMSYLTGF